MPDININIDVYCGGCGAGLCHQSKAEERRGDWGITVEPCEKCLDAAKEEGYSNGYGDGSAEKESEE